MKKVFLAALGIALLLGLLPLTAAALDTEETPFSLRETVIQQAHDSYYRSRATAGRRSFHGKCGLMVAHQLYNLGITKGRQAFNGNDHYDYYADRTVTSGGYYISSYSASEYTLREALLAVSDNGTKDVQNILVGFQWTNTDAGRKYGHAMLINGIVGGTVYFVESFDCSLGGKEGTVISCSIKDFAKYYDRWTRFEGIVHFGSGTYYDVCPNVSTDVTVQSRFATVLRSEPAVVGRQGCVRLRSVAAGERLHVTAIYESERTYYYRVETNEGFGFVAAGAVSLLQVNTRGLSVSELDLPRRIQAGVVPPFGGKITDSYGTLSSLEVCITDEQGQMIRRELADVQDSYGDLSVLREGLLFDLLEPGLYQVDIYASRACPVVVGSYTDSYYSRVLVESRSLQVGGNPGQTQQMAKQMQQPKDGWFWEQGTWYCYENGQPCSGWLIYLGVRYYLQPDGSVTVGAQNVAGKQLYFSATGALITGWQTLEGKTYYRMPDGMARTGWQTLEGKLYCFDDNGIMLTDTEQTKDGVIYLIAKDGVATVKPTETQEAQNG